MQQVLPEDARGSEDVHPLCYALAAGPSMPYWRQARDAQLESVAVIASLVVAVILAIPSSSSEGPFPAC